MEELSISFVSDIRSIIEQGKINAFDSINACMIRTYWNVGRRLIEEEQHGQHRAEYGKYIAKTLAENLEKEYGESFNYRNLCYFRQFYLCFNDLQIVNARVHNLTWTHFRHLLRVADEKARLWYLNEAASQMWSTRTLERNISTHYYQRLLSTDTLLKENEFVSLSKAIETKDRLDFIKDPVVAEFLELKPNSDFNESELENAILRHLEKFLMELGKGFALVDRQKHIFTELNDYYVDLVFYNYILKCFVLIDLKTSKITHQAVGQMDMYRRMFDELMRTEGDNPTIGIVLCAQTDEDIAKYSILHDNDYLFQAKYMPYMPTEAELRAEIEREKEVFRLQMMHPNDSL